MNPRCRNCGSMIHRHPVLNVWVHSDGYRLCNFTRLSSDPLPAGSPFRKPAPALQADPA